jgi:predicted nucleic acid-binding protein
VNDFGRQFVLVDTNVCIYLTEPRKDLAIRYMSWIGSRQMALNFQILAELLNLGVNHDRMVNLEALLAAAVPLPHGDSTSVWYSRTFEARRALKRGNQLGGDAGDADRWIVASALEYGIPCVSHDRQFVALARALRVDTFTALPGLSEGNPRA